MLNGHVGDTNADNVQIQIPSMQALIKGHTPYNLEWQEFASIPDLAQFLFSVALIKHRNYCTAATIVKRNARHPTNDDVSRHLNHAAWQQPEEPV